MTVILCRVYRALVIITGEAYPYEAEDTKEQIQQTANAYRMLYETKWKKSE
jgi:hypothetical protein